MVNSYQLTDPRTVLAVLPLAAASLARQRAAPPTIDALAPPIRDYFTAAEHGLSERSRRDLSRYVTADALAGADERAQVVSLADGIVGAAAWQLSWELARADQAERIARGDANQGAQWTYATLATAELDLLGATVEPNPDPPAYLTAWLQCSEAEHDPRTFERAGLGPAELAVLYGVVLPD